MRVWLRPGQRVPSPSQASWATGQLQPIWPAPQPLAVRPCCSAVQLPGATHVQPGHDEVRALHVGQVAGAAGLVDRVVPLRRGQRGHGGAAGHGLDLICAGAPNDRQGEGLVVAVGRREGVLGLDGGGGCVLAAVLAACVPAGCAALRCAEVWQRGVALIGVIGWAGSTRRWHWCAGVVCGVCLCLCWEKEGMHGCGAVLSAACSDSMCWCAGAFVLVNAGAFVSHASQLTHAWMWGGAERSMKRSDQR